MMRRRRGRLGGSERDRGGKGLVKQFLLMMMIIMMTYGILGIVSNDSNYRMLQHHVLCTVHTTASFCQLLNPLLNGDFGRLMSSTRTALGRTEDARY